MIHISSININKQCRKKNGSKWAILSWCPQTWHVYIVYNILSLNITSIYIISHILWKKFMKLAEMFRHVTAVFAHGQCDTYRSNVWAIIPCLLFWRIIMKFCSKVQFIKTIRRRHESALYLKVKVILEGWMFRPVFRVHSIYPTFFEGFAWNVPQMLSLLIRCVEVISQPFLLQVKLRLNV